MINEEPNFRDLCAQFVKLLENCPVTGDPEWIADRMLLLYCSKQAFKAENKKEAKPSATDFTTDNINDLKTFSSANCILIGQKQLVQFHKLQKDYRKSCNLDTSYPNLEKLVEALEGKTKEYISFWGLKVILTDWPDLLVVGHSANTQAY